MECRACSEALTAYMDGELGSDQASQLEAHLQTCSGCRHEHDSLFFSYGLVDRLSELDPAPALWNRIRAGIELEQVPTRRSWIPLIDFFRPRWIPVTALAGIAAFAVALSLFTFHDPEQALVEERLRSYIEYRENNRIDHVNIFRRVQENPERERFYNPFSLTAADNPKNPETLE